MLYRNAWVVLIVNTSQTHDEAVHRLAAVLNNLWKAKANLLKSQKDAEHPEAVERAQKLLLEDAMAATDTLLSEGKISNLNIESRTGVNRDIHYSV